MSKQKNRLALERALKDIADGDRQAMRQLYSLTFHDLYAICFGVVKNREAAEDVLQEVYIKIWNRAAGFDPEKGSPLAWLGLIARNSAIDRVRARNRRQTIGDAPLKYQADETELVEDRLVRESEGAALHHELDQLAEPEQSYLRQAYMEGQTYSQVAKRRGVPLGTVKTRIRRGLMALRAKVKRD